ncbi:YheC/YheD family protein [Ammoniphilus sp. CFH 90114]|uniref:YheC/YheD family endospore coat-associated protein n=1 Tax=Ammoniphilus sp. CFH 90114 TaxID=2493665 RepID=UPI00100EAB1E|nr:YheC/YheD family protein [Ammoniphilus sp. CFH 90114]RXT15269.1 YheC/YheD family protein [Ammoniphilus sp. CFH 90114]
MNKPIIGILTWRQGVRFEEPTYLRQLILEGRSLGCTVFLFSHEDVLENKKRVRGFIPSTNGWVSQIYPWPDIVIDRCRKGEPGYLALRRQKDLFVYANNTYTNKWNATQLFSREEELRSWIPKTVEYSPNHLQQMLKEFPLLYIKPGNGTGGRSILKISHDGTKYSLLGRARNLRTKSASFSTAASLISVVNRWVNKECIRKGNFMIQQGLDLALIPDRVADTRLLIQKNEVGEWCITGSGVRVGPRKSPTSNLHNGGKPVKFSKLMKERFGEEKAERIKDECKLLGFTVVKTIEKHFGSMMEFGLDIGIDVNGRVWLIEVNPKPGRDIFKELGRPELYRKSVQRPLQYALHLVKNKQESSGPIATLVSQEEKESNEEKAENN